MSNAVFPSFPGLEWNITRQPIWSTSARNSVSGRRFAVANFSFPRYKYKLSYSFLRQGQGNTELAQLVGFFNARQGRFDSFLFTDPDDSTATNQGFGIGDGITQSFQLVRSFGGFIEPVYDAVAPSIRAANVVQGGGYTVSATGLVTFAVAPASGVVLDWSGSYYRRMYFAQDSAEFNKFMSNLWELKKLEMETYRP